MKHWNKMLKTNFNTYTEKLVLEIAGVFHMHTYSLTDYKKRAVLICKKVNDKIFTKNDHLIQK